MAMATSGGADSAGASDGALPAAFGLAISGPLRVRGLAPANGTAGRSLRLERVAESQIEAACPAADGVRAGGVGDGRHALVLSGHGSAGYVWRAPGYGLFRVTPDGRRGWCAPAHRARRHWQRMLLGQVLPLAAVLQGLEVIHAGAVAVDDGVVALTGPSGTGKSTLVAALMLGGARFVADDVVALEPDREGVIAHPGSSLLRLRLDAARELGDGAPGLEALGSIEGSDDVAVELEVARTSTPLPLRALVVIEPAGRETRPVLRPLDRSDPRPLLAATFNRFLRGPDRLTRLLDTSGRMAASAALLHIAVPRDADPRLVAGAIIEGL